MSVNLNKTIPPLRRDSVLRVRKKKCRPLSLRWRHMSASACQQVNPSAYSPGRILKWNGLPRAHSDLSSGGTLSRHACTLASAVSSCRWRAVGSHFPRVQRSARPQLHPAGRQGLIATGRGHRFKYTLRDVICDMPGSIRTNASDNESIPDRSVGWEQSPIKARAGCKHSENRRAQVNDDSESEAAHPRQRKLRSQSRAKGLILEGSLYILNSSAGRRRGRAQIMTEKAGIKDQPYCSHAVVDQPFANDIAYRTTRAAVANGHGDCSKHGPLATSVVAVSMAATGVGMHALPVLDAGRPSVVEICP